MALLGIPSFDSNHPKKEATVPTRSTLPAWKKSALGKEIAEMLHLIEEANEHVHGVLLVKRYDAKGEFFEGWYAAIVFSDETGWVDRRIAGQAECSPSALGHIVKAMTEMFTADGEYLPDEEEFKWLHRKGFFPMEWDLNTSRARSMAFFTEEEIAEAMGLSIGDDF